MQRTTHLKIKSLSLLTLLSISVLSLAACGNDNILDKSETHQSEIHEQASEPHQVPEGKVDKSREGRIEVIKKDLITYTMAQSPGPTQNYYYENGHPEFTESVKAGEHKFQPDEKGRSGVAIANLTYGQFEASKGSRQGTPLDPPYWPRNSKTAIDYALTGRTYHGYMWNRSHSIADSLLGVASYDSEYNFTAGTRPQNVGANQKGGMRYAESLVENYWRANPNTSQTVMYQTTPVYEGDERIPRGSIVDIKSSDSQLNTEIVVINSAEGINIDYQ